MTLCETTVTWSGDITNRVVSATVAVLASARAGEWCVCGEGKLGFQGVNTYFVSPLCDV